jgi:hypothetical protein
MSKIIPARETKSRPNIIENGPTSKTLKLWSQENPDNFTWSRTFSFTLLIEPLANTQAKFQGEDLQ